MKLKLFMLYLRHQRDGVIIDCALCGSTEIKFEQQHSAEVYHPDKKGGGTTSTIYTSKYECGNCGATCNNRQEWFSANQKDTL